MNPILYAKDLYPQNLSHLHQKHISFRKLLVRVEVNTRPTTYQAHKFGKTLKDNIKYLSELNTETFIINPQTKSQPKLFFKLLIPCLDHLSSLHTLAVSFRFQRDLTGILRFCLEKLNNSLSSLLYT